MCNSFIFRLAWVYCGVLITGGRLGDIFGRKSYLPDRPPGFALGLRLLLGSPGRRLADPGRGCSRPSAARGHGPQGAGLDPRPVSAAERRGRWRSAIYGVTLGLPRLPATLGGALVRCGCRADWGGVARLPDEPVRSAMHLPSLPPSRCCGTRGRRRPGAIWWRCLFERRRWPSFVLPLVEGRRARLALVVDRDAANDADFRRVVPAVRDPPRQRGASRRSRSRCSIAGPAAGLGAIMTLYATAAFFLTLSIYLRDRPRLHGA